MSTPAILNIYDSIRKIIIDCFLFIKLTNELDKFISLKNQLDGCYSILNVEKNDSRQIIEKQYDKLIKEYTPNKNLIEQITKETIMLYWSIRKIITDCYNIIIKNKK